MEAVKVKENKKYLHIEIMRIFAIIFVIFNHTGNNGFFLFSQRPVGGIQFWCYLIISVFCKFSVPLFFAISGAILLQREEPVSVLWKKRILKMVCVLVLISLFYYFQTAHANMEAIDIKLFFQTLYSGKHKYHLGFLYTYITFLISLPFLRYMVREMKPQHYYYLIIISLFLNGVRSVLEYLIWKGQITLIWEIKSFWVVNTPVLYPCIGYFCQHKINNNKIGKNLLYIWSINILGIGLSCFMTYYKGLHTGSFLEGESQTFHENFVILNTIAIYLSCKYIFQHWNCSNRIEKIILSMGKCTFGIYLIHPVVMSMGIMKSIRTILLEIGINYMIAIFIQCAIVMLICYFVVLIMRQIPIINKLV